MDPGLWPNLLLLALLGLIAKGTGRLLGAGRALFAMALVMMWMPIRGITFAPRRIDHHNLQILLTTTMAMAMAMVLPGRAGQGLTDKTGMPNQAIQHGLLSLNTKQT